MSRDRLTLDGWEEIATHLELVSGVTRSVRTARRWAALEDDPLPVRTTPGGRDVICDAEELEAWWKRKTKGEQMALPL